MRLLTIENHTHELNELPDEVDDLRFCIFSNSDPKEPDYFFVPLIFLESFNAPALVLKIGPFHVKMPVDWQMLIGEPDFGDLEVVPLTSLNDRDFKAFCYNPLSDFSPRFLEIELADVFTDQKWYFPKLKNGQMLCVPLHQGPNPVCAYFVKDIPRNCEIVDYGKAW